MADSFTYELAYWAACPSWWKQFVYTVDPEAKMYVKELEARIHEQLESGRLSGRVNFSFLNMKIISVLLC